MGNNASDSNSRSAGYGPRLAAEARLEPCSAPFPEGLGPFSVRQTSFKASDIEVLGFDKSAGGHVRFPRSLFDRSKALEALASQLDSTQSWASNSSDTLELRISPYHAVNLPEDICLKMGIPCPSSMAAPAPEVQFAWVYPASFDSRCETSSPESFSSCVDVMAENLDMENADVSFLTIGGYIYFNLVEEHPLWIEVDGLPEHEGEDLKIETSGISTLEEIKAACEASPACLGFSYHNGLWYPKKRSTGFKPSMNYSQKHPEQFWKWYYLSDRAQIQQAELKWMFADAEGLIGGRGMARKDPLGRFWSKAFWPEDLAENIANYMQAHPQSRGRPILVRAARTDKCLEKEFANPEEAMDWLRSDGVLEATRSFDGDWTKGTISGSLLTWSATGNVSNIEVVDGKTIATTSKGEKYTAVLTDDDKLLWSHGDVWMRQAPSPTKGDRIIVKNRVGEVIEHVLDDPNFTYKVRFLGGETEDWFKLDDVDLIHKVEYFPPSRKQKLELLSAYAIRFSPKGALQFSRPQDWSKAWTTRLIEEGRFRPITAQKWVDAGARYLCWVRPDEVLPDEHGNGRPLAHHGGFAFLFHDLEEEDDQGIDRYFEVVGSSGPCSPASLERTRSDRSCRSLPFSLGFVPSGHEARIKGKLFTLAREGKWKLVLHLLSENRFLASAHADALEGGHTILHICAQKDLWDDASEFLRFLKDRGASFDATNTAGQKAEELGSKEFKMLVRSVWGIGPDLFDDRIAWFVSQDQNGSGSLGIADLSMGLAAAYRCDKVGARWLQSLLNVTYSRGVISQDEFCTLYDQLQFSEDFAGRRQQRRPALFRGNLQALSEEEELKLLALEKQLNQMRSKHGWQPGKTAPETATPLFSPAPSAEGSANAEARMKSARAMLSFTFQQTRELSAKTWQNGFRIDFAGQEGLDDGGLTKAWVNEIAYALWGDDTLFDIEGSGSMFKSDTVESLLIDGENIDTLALYRWTGQFVAYVLYSRCVMDCRLCPWVFRSLSRSAAPRDFHCSRSAVDVEPWPDSHAGEDRMLRDLASLDYELANSFWRIAHEMTQDELRWLSFTCKDREVVEDGGEMEVTMDNKAEYVRRSCEIMLFGRCQSAMQAFNNGFLEVIPDRFLNNVPEEGILRLLMGKEEVSDDQLRALQSTVVPKGLVPSQLAENPKVRQAADWVFRVALEGDGTFRTRFLEFWIGMGRVPLAGLTSVLPPPRLQVMVQKDGASIKRIASWPKTRLPEGHTCGNELWIALPDSYEEFAKQLRLAVQNFEAGIALV